MTEKEFYKRFEETKSFYQGYEDRIHQMIPGRKAKDVFNLLYPPAVKVDYHPSGRSEVYSVPVLILGGILGGGVGYLLSWLIAWLSLGLFHLLSEAGFCLSILLDPAGFVYMLSPLAILGGAVFGLNAAGEFAACRNRLVGGISGAILGIAAGLAMIYNSMELNTEVDYIVSIVENLGESLGKYILMVTLGLFLGFTSVWLDGMVWHGILMLLSIIISVWAGVEVAMNPFCEATKTNLIQTIRRVFRVESTRELLFGLFERDGALVSNLPECSPNKDQRLELVVESSKGQASNLVELHGYFVHEYRDSEGKVQSDNEERLLYSEWMDKSTLDEFLANFNIKVSKPA